MPNPVLDLHMPLLRDTELRVLLVVLRQTLGWRGEQEGTRKERDWISHGQLCRRTGRASAAVSSAVEALVNAGLIAVEDASGNALGSTAQRRRHLGRLFYRVGGGFCAAKQPDGKSGCGNVDKSPPEPSGNCENNNRHSLQK